MTLILFSTAGYRGSHYYCGNSGMKIFKKLKVVFLPQFNRCNLVVQNIKKMVQNIKIRISCDVRVYTRKILQSSVFPFPPSWIWAMGVSSCSQSHELQKWRPRSKYMYWGNIDILQKFEKSFGCGPFPQTRVFAVHATGVQEMYQRKDFSYFINLIRNSSTLRPLELDVQPTFCRFSAATRTHVWSIDACLESCFRGSQ